MPNPTLAQLREIASDASMLVEDVDGSWVEHVGDLRIDGERLPSELACHVEVFSPAQCLSLLDEIERLRALVDEACMALVNADRDETAARILKELSHAD